MRIAAPLAVVVASAVLVGCPQFVDSGGEVEPPGEGEGEPLPPCPARSLGPASSTDDRGVLVVLAGEGGAGFVDGDQPRFNGIGGIGAGTDANGDFVVVSDIFNGTLRRIDRDANVVTTVLGVPLDVGAIDGVCDDVRLNGPRGLVVDPRDGTVWFGDGPCLRHADLVTGETTTIAGDCTTSGDTDAVLGFARFGFLFHDIELDPVSGKLFVADRVNDAIRVIDIERARVDTLAVGFDGPGGLALDLDTNTLYVADTFHHQLKAIDLDDGAVTVIAGSGVEGSDDGPAATATLDAPQALALQGDRLVFGGFDGRLRALDLFSAEVTTLADDTAGFFSPFGTVSSDDDGDGERVLLADLDGGLLALDGDDVTLLLGADRPTGYRDGSGVDARFALPASIVANNAGDAVFVSDSFNNAIRVVQLDDGATTTLLGDPDRIGDVDGAFATAELSFPSGLAIDAAGTTMYVSATGVGAVKKLDLVTETMSSVVDIEDPWEVALDEAINTLYVISSAGQALHAVDLATNTERVVASGFVFPIGVAVVPGSGADPGRVFVADNEDHVLYEIDVDAGTKTAVLGTPGFQGPADGSVDAALLSFPSSLHVADEDGVSVLYIAETGGQIVRRVSLVDFASTFVVGDARLSGSLPAGARVALAGAPILNPQDVVVVGGDIVIAGDTTVVVARP